VCLMCAMASNAPKSPTTAEVVEHFKNPPPDDRFSEQLRLAAAFVDHWQIAVLMRLAAARLEEPTKHPRAGAEPTLAPSTKPADVPGSAALGPNREFESPDGGHDDHCRDQSRPGAAVEAADASKVPAPYDTQGGTRKVFSTAIPGAQQLVLDWEHALYCRADTTPDPCGIARMIDPSEHASFVFNILQHVNSDHRLTPAASRVAFWLTHHANRETHMCWPSIPRLAKLSRLSDKAVRLAIQSLEVAGYIEVDRTSGKHHVYTLLEQEKWDLKRFMKRNGNPGKKYRTTPVKSTAGPRYNLPPNHSHEHLELNARIAEAMPAQIKQAKKRMEEELSDWIADSLVDEREESKIRTVVEEILDLYAAGRGSREGVEAAFAGIRSAVLRRFAPAEKETSHAN
jgi:hypothetical protein